MFRTRLLRTPKQALGLRASSANTTSFTPSLSAGFNAARRNLHSVPALPHDYSQGVPNLMSAGGFAIAWTDYMKLTLDKLNAMVVGE
jgi:Fe-Mn family superoxide dismutase